MFCHNIYLMDFNVLRTDDTFCAKIQENEICVQDVKSYLALHIGKPIFTYPQS